MAADFSPTENLILTTVQVQAMRRHVGRRAPQEACGLVGGRGGRAELVLPVPNADRSPVRFHMEPHAQLRAFQRLEAQGLELVAVYHSHPEGPDRPSATDVAEAAYPVVNLLWYRQTGRWRLRGFRIQAGRASEVSLEILPAG